MTHSTKEKRALAFPGFVLFYASRRFDSASERNTKNKIGDPTERQSKRSKLEEINDEEEVALLLSIPSSILTKIPEFLSVEDAGRLLLSTNKCFSWESLTREDVLGDPIQGVL